MKTKYSLILSLAGAATLAACGGNNMNRASAEDYSTWVVPQAIVTGAPADANRSPVLLPGGIVTIEQGQTLSKLDLSRPGFGRVDSMTPVDPSGIKRVAVVMDDGTVQIVDTKAPVKIGERVQITRHDWMYYSFADPASSGPSKR